MTRDEIIEAAWKSGVWIPAGQDHAREQEIDRLERFATLVAAAEREACEKVCDEVHDQWRWGSDDPHSGPADCAAAIRARGESDAC